PQAQTRSAIAPHARARRAVLVRKFTVALRPGWGILIGRTVARGNWHACCIASSKQCRIATACPCFSSVSPWFASAGRSRAPPRSPSRLPVLLTRCRAARRRSRTRTAFPPPSASSGPRAARPSATALALCDAELRRHPEWQDERAGGASDQVVGDEEDPVIARSKSQAVAAPALHFKHAVRLSELEKVHAPQKREGVSIESEDPAEIGGVGAVGRAIGKDPR